MVDSACEVKLGHSYMYLFCLLGAAPFFMSQRAVDKLKGRKTKPATYNLDLNLIADYWGWFKPQRSYHHTGTRIGGWGCPLSSAAL